MTKEERAAYNKVYYAGRKDEMTAYHKTYRADNREELAVYGKAYRDEHCAEIAAVRKAYRQSDIGKAAKRAAAKRYYLKLNLANAKISQRTLNAWAIQVKQFNPRCDWCLCCDDLEAHHVYPKSIFPDLALDIENGQTLCKKHHDEIHSSGAKQKNGN